MLDAKLLATLMLLAAAITVHAAEWPTKPVRIIVPFAPGGTIDAQARPIAAHLTEVLKQPVLVENRPGAGTTIATAHVAKSPPDGHTLLITLRTLAVTPVVYPKLAYDPVQDFDTVSTIEVTYWLFCAHPSLPVRGFKDLVKLAKARPGELNYAVTGIGTDNHLTMERLTRAVGIRMGQIPYGGGGPAVTAMLGGHVEVMLVPGPLSVPHIKAGKMRPLAIFNDEGRSPVFPNVPTIAEEGLRGYGAGAWSGMLVPKGTPPHIINLLNAEIRKIVERNRQTGNQFIEGIQVPRSSTPAGMAKILREEVALWKRVAQEIGFKPE
ncbi:MAG TPA: tripartite tricarboxylate transporter substrate binding protein [Burkholderiales bacterium]|nr:tripartite tricarboxylate transporter substrate binding protein [Burkholderiales bacterium]